MNTMQLSCFVEVAAQLSFSKAAEALHVSQPTVSHQIKALEDELGCALLVRSTRSVRLTDDGFAFLELDDLAQGGRMAVGDPHHCAAAIVDLQRKASAHLPAEAIMMGYSIEIALALANAGVAFTVQADIPAMQVPPLRYVPVEGLPSVSLGIRVRRGRRPATLDRFIEILAEELQRTPPLRPM